MMNNLYSLYGRTTTNQRKFTDIFPDVTSFTDFITSTSQIPCLIKTENVPTVYYLLYSRYGNSHIASSDENQFKYKLASIIFSYGPTWEKRLDLQNKLRTLTDDQLRIASQTILNHAYNPSTEPADDTRQIMGKLDQQNVSFHDRGILDGYERLLLLLDTDVTSDFLRRFKKLFITFVYPGCHLLYETDISQD